MIEKEKKPSILILSGPTASGKSSLAEQLARQFQLPIINADSRQIYKEMDIGTAKPSKEILESIPYFLIDILSITEQYSAGKFCTDVYQLLDNELSHYPIVIISGGTDFYIQALLNGLAETPSISSEIKEKWRLAHIEKGISYLKQELSQRDPDYFNKMDHNNPHRVLRALMVIDQCGKSLSEYESSKGLVDSYEVSHFAILRDRNELYERINSRVDKMVETGLILEVKDLLPYKQSIAMDTVGYRELLDYFNGKYSLSFAIDKIKQHSRNYAKRQMTWLRKLPNLTTIHPDHPSQIEQWVKQRLKDV